MLVEYDKTVVLVQHGTDKEICILTESKELEYTKEYEKNWTTPWTWGNDYFNNTNWFTIYWNSSILFKQKYWQITKHGLV